MPESPIKTWIVWFGQFRLGTIKETNKGFEIEAPGHDCTPLIFREGWVEVMQFFFRSVPCGAQQIKFVVKED